MSLSLLLRQPESRAVKYAGRNPQDPRLAEFFESISGGTHSGVSVTSQSAMRMIAVWACIRVIMEDVGKLPLIPYRRQGRDKVRMDGTPLFRLLHDQPNPEMCSCTFREAVTSDALKTGNGFAEIVYDQAVRVSELWPIDSSTVQFELDNGQMIYEVDGRRVDARTILHLKGPGGDGVTGWSPIRTAREAIGAGLAAERFAASFYSNNAAGGGILKHPGKLSMEAAKRLRESFSQNYAGSANAYRTKILEEGMDWSSEMIPPEDAQFIETRQFSVEEIARLYRVAPHKIQHLLRSTFSNIEEQNIDHVSDTLMPWLVRWEQEIARKVISQQQRAQGVYAEFMVEGLLRGKMEDQASFFQSLFNVGAMSQNDMRAKLNMNSIGPEGDVYYVPSNMMPARSEADIEADRQRAEQIQQQAAEADDEPDDEDAGDEDETDERSARVIAAHTDLVRDALERIRRIEDDRIGSRRKRAGFGQWLDGFRESHVEHVRAAIGAPLDAAAKSIWATVRTDGEPDMEAVMRFTARVAEQHCERLPDGIDDEAEVIVRGLVEAMA